VDKVNTFLGAFLTRGPFTTGDVSTEENKRRGEKVDKTAATRKQHCAIDIC